MLDELTLLHFEWLKNPEYGFKAMYDTVPGARRDVRWDIYNFVEDPELVEDQDPPRQPAILVVADSDAPVEVERKKPALLTRRVIMAFLFLTTGLKHQDATRFTGWATRAMMKSLMWLNEPLISGPRLHDRTQDGVKLVTMDWMTQERATGTVGRSRVSGLVLTSVQALDTYLPVQS